MKSTLLALLALMGASPVAAQACGRSLFTSVADGDCRPVASLDVGRVIFSADQDQIERCPAPPGLALYLVSDEARSWYAIERAGRIWPLEKDIVYDQAIPGNFPNVAQVPKVEWRLVGNRVIGFIFRVGYQSRNGTDNLSRLHVYDLSVDEPVRLGVVRTNEAASKLLDQACR